MCIRDSIRGTAWMTPPTYRQSERAYNGNGQHAEDYVPEYTETANEQDLGYYDERGEFHFNSKSEYIPPPKLETADNTNSSPSPIQRPENAFTRAPTDIEMDFTRPDHPPPNASGSNDQASSIDFRRPNHPPPTATGSSSCDESSRSDHTGDSSVEEQDVLALPKKAFHR